jgi:dynein intermediate chain 1
MDGNLIHKDSEEGKRQLTHKPTTESDDHHSVDSHEASAKVDSSTSAGADYEEDGGAPKATSGSSGKEKKLTNQFNFSERASQTYNNPARERATMTEPPPRLTYSSNATQWEIYDAYLEDFEQQVNFFNVLTFF